MRTYDTNEGEFVDFGTLDAWHERDKSKDATIARLTTELAQLRTEVSVVEAARVLLGDGGMMPVPAKLAAVKAHLQRDSRVQPVAIIEAWNAALRALTETG